MNETESVITSFAEDVSTAVSRVSELWLYPATKYQKGAWKIVDNESFFKMPKVLFTDEYKDLSAEAKLLYGLMLDRMQLSAINGWCDKNGEVFIFYTIAETSEMLGCGHDKATRLQRELEKHNLVHLLLR